MLVFFSYCQVGMGQTYSPNSNNTYTTCSGTFYDSGGANNNYGSNQNYTVTFCSGNGQPIYLSFSSFNLQSGGDFLLAYAGSNTAAPLIGTYSATSPGTISSASGCITFNFVSNNSNNQAGWAATIGCGTPPSSSFNMTTGSSSSCNTVFYDNGGPNGNYSNNQNLTYTICPGTAGSFVQVNFTTFNLQNNDFLYVYNGSNTSAPLIGTFSNTVSPSLIQATAPNSTGCLTFVFTSNQNGNSAGWVANVSCYVPCQTITANLNSTSPAAQSDGIIRICPGQSIQFNGSGTFSQSGTGASYLWNFGNNTTATGSTATATYNTAGTYYVNLDISLNGCTSSNSINQIVQVSTNTTITTSATPLVLCQGQTANLSATVTPQPYIQSCTTPYSGLTYLLDGNGVTYSTSIPVDCYNSTQTIQSANDISEICLTMEHSYLGDLSISITCPNGQTALLKAYPGGAGTYLGCPLDDPAVGPGTYRTYCFTPTATTLLVNGATSNCGVPAAPSINGGNYMPVQPFTNLIGCPLNGSWTISVTDNLNLDNGYISTWDINFNPNLPGASGSFTPTITSRGWVSTTGLTSTGGTTATVAPTTVGQNCYTYTATNNFGCTTTQVQCITVNPGVTPTFTQVAPICSGGTLGALSTTSNNGITGTWSPALNNTATTTYTFTPTAGQCATTTTMTIVVNPAPVVATNVTNETCTTADNGIIAVTASGPNNGYNVSWTGTSSGNPAGTEIATSGGAYSITNLNAGNYTITVSNTAGCSSTTTAVVTQPTPLVATISAPPILCAGSTTTITVGASGGTGPYIGTGTYTVTAGTYTYTVTDANGCTSTVTITIANPAPIVLSNITHN